MALYERPGRSDPARWPVGDDPAALRATVVKRTKGMGPPASRLITGKRGGIPQRHRRVPAGALAELAAHSGRTEYAEADGLAVAARSVCWKGRLAKLAVVAVPWEFRYALAPQVAVRSVVPTLASSPGRPWPHVDEQGRTADNNSKTNQYCNRQKRGHAPTPEIQDHHLVAAPGDVRPGAAGEV